MADEAVLRIILDDAGKAGGRTTTAAGGAVPSVSAGAQSESGPNENRQQNELWSALKSVIPLIGAISPLLSAAVNLLTTIGKIGSGVQDEQRKTTEATNSVRRSVDNLSKPAPSAKQVEAATVPVAKPIYIPNALPADLPEAFPIDLPEVEPVKAEVPMALSTPEDYLPEHENMTPDRAGRSVRDKLIASDMTDTAEIQRRSAEVSKYVNETSQNRLNVYNRVLEQTGSTEKAKAAAESGGIPKAQPAEVEVRKVEATKVPDALPLNIPNALPVEAKSAAEIANKFKVPKSGFGTTMGANSTTQAADIAKLGTNVGGEAGAAEAAGAAEVGGGAMAGLAAAAGPIALAVVAADAIQKAVISTVKSVVGTVGDVVTAIASPNADPSVPIAQLGDVVSKTGEKLGILGIGAVFAGESLKALSSVMQALDATAQRYAEYSAPISQALAAAEVQQTLGDMRRAQEISPEMVRYIQAQSDLQQKFEDVKIKLLQKIMPAVTSMVQILEVIMSGGENIIKGFEILASPLTAIAKTIAEILGMQHDDRVPEVEDPTTILFDPRFDQGGRGTPRSPGFVPDV